MNEPRDVIGKIMPPPPTINQVFLDIVQRIDALAARIDVIERDREIERQYDMEQAERNESRVGGSTE